jgi:hypothetical protein
MGREDVLGAEEVEAVGVSGGHGWGGGRLSREREKEVCRQLT